MKQLFLLSLLAMAAHTAPVTWEPIKDGKDDPGERPVPPKVVQSLDDCNVTWDSPGGDSFGSMPLGNGDVGANVWVEENGDLVFYLSKVDAFDACHLLPKLGRIRLRLDPALDLDEFRQTLILREAAIEVRAGDVQLRVWIDA